MHGTTRAAVWLVCVVGVAGCTASTPRDIDNGCEIFRERHSWYRAAQRADERWGVPVEVQLAIIHQESRFQATAKPPRRKILWVIPGPRPSSSYGYTQALRTTWSEYQRENGLWGADRDDFRDAVDFIGWYANRTSRRVGIPRDDAYRLYLAYHEGDGGYRRGSYRTKPVIMAAAARVRDRAVRYRRQLAACREELDRPRFWWFW